MKDIKAWSRQDLIQAVSVMAGVAGWAFALIWLAYYAHFFIYGSVIGGETPQQIMEAKAAWGQLGDFVGGTLNPLISALGLVGLIFTMLLQHEAMMRTQADSKLNIASLREQAEFSMLSARLHSLTATLGVITEMHKQAVEVGSGNAIPLLEKKEAIARDIIDINDLLAKRSSSNIVEPVSD